VGTVAGDASLPTVRQDDRHAPQYVTGNAMLLTFADATFDAAVGSEVLQHASSPAQFIIEVARVLRPGGVFCFDTPNRTWLACLSLISIAENLDWAPRSMHDYDLFLTPSEVYDHLVSPGLRLRGSRGFALERGAFGAMRRYLRRRDIGGFRLINDLRFVMTGYADEPTEPNLAAVEEEPIAVERDAR